MVARCPDRELPLLAGARATTKSAYWISMALLRWVPTPDRCAKLLALRRDGHELLEVLEAVLIAARQPG